jgi:pimeloyl-ACP methyl ester carboxylesterase
MFVNGDVAGHVLTRTTRRTGIAQMSDPSAITFIKAMGFERVDLFEFSMGGMIAQEIVLMEPQLVRKMIIAGTARRRRRHQQGGPCYVPRHGTRLSHPPRP